MTEKRGELWRFISEGETVYEKAGQRTHDWYFNPEILFSGDLFMVKVTVPEGEGHDFHVHPKMDEILYVLEGRAEQWVEREMKILEPGDSVYISSNVAHGTFNCGSGDLVFLAILSPESGWESGTVDVSMNEPYSELRISKE